MAVRTARHGGVKEFPGKDLTLLFGQNQGHASEFAPLAFVDGHGVATFKLGEPCGVEGPGLEAGPPRPVFGEENAHVAVEEAQPVIVPADENGGVVVFENAFDGLVHPGHPGDSVAYGAKDAVVGERAKKGPGGVVLQDLLVIAGKPGEDGRIGRAGNPENAFGSLLQDAQHGLLVALPNGRTERENPAMLAEAVVFAEFHDGVPDLLREGKRKWKRKLAPSPAFRGHDPANLGFKGRGTAGVHPADVPENAAGLDGGELARVSEQNDAGIGRKGGEGLGHEGEVHHGGFVHDEQVGGKGVLRIVAEVGRVSAGLQEAMDGHDFVGHEFENFAGEAEGVDGPPDGFAQAKGGLAGGGAKGDPDPGLLFEQEREDLDNGGGLSGSGAAGDDGEFLECGDDGGL